LCVWFSVVCSSDLGTLFTLFLVPMVYTYLARDHHRTLKENEPAAHPKPAA
jgi:hypothetical protein